MSEPFQYVGTELDLFAAAVRWKGYVRQRIAGFLTGRVLEVGAGLGGTTRAFCRGTEERWVCLEPDPALAGRLEAERAAGRLPGSCEVVVGTLSDQLRDAEFDAILYMDVLEHIEDDAAEMARAASRLAPGGRIIALSPAHQWLFTPFDAAIGHCRRYTRGSLQATTPPGTRLEWLGYLDSVGLCASLANKVLLHQAMPTSKQVAFWDGVLVRASAWVDPVLGYRVGKSVLGIWRRASDPTQPGGSGAAGLGGPVQ